MSSAIPRPTAGAELQRTARGAVRDAVEHHPKTGGWHPTEWGCELAGTACQLFSTFCFVATMESPLSPAHHAIRSATLRLALIGLVNVAGTYLSRRHEGPRPPEPRPGRGEPVVSAG